MQSLTSAYEDRFGPVRSEQHLYAGLALLAGSLMVFFTAILFATTTLPAVFGLTISVGWGIAGVLGGLGLPCAVISLLVVHPVVDNIARRIQLGAVICILGTMFFGYAFPTRWVGDSPDLSFFVLLVYFIGAVIMFGYVFYTLATVRLRNSPGGTVDVSVLKDDAQKVSDSGGTTSSTPTEPPTTTTSPEPEPDPQIEHGVSTMAATMAEPNETSDPATEDAEVLDTGDDTPDNVVNQHCGNCKHLRYKSNGGQQKPYCALHDETMTDLDPCGQWESQDTPDF